MLCIEILQKKLKLLEIKNRYFNKIVSKKKPFLLMGIFIDISSNMMMFIDEKRKKIILNTRVLKNLATFSENFEEIQWIKMYCALGDKLFLKCVLLIKCEILSG